MKRAEDLDDELIQSLKRLEGDLDTFDLDSLLSTVPTSDEIIAEAVRTADKIVEDLEEAIR